MGFRAGIPQIEPRIRNESKPRIVPSLPRLLLPGQLATDQRVTFKVCEVEDNRLRDQLSSLIRERVLLLFF